MQASLIKKELFKRRTVYNGSCEIGVESESVLPDYCSDIEKILRCSLVPRVNSKHLEAGRLVVNGTAFLRLVYLDPDGRMQSFETQIPFSKNIQVQEGGENPCIWIRMQTEYSNCHAISPRRFKLRGAVSMTAKVTVCNPLTFVTDIENDGVEVKRQKIEAVVPVSSVSEGFTVMEEYELTKGPISSVVRMSANPKILEQKIIPGKIFLKGEVELLIVYLCEGDVGTCEAKYVIPVNQILSCDDAQEGDGVDLRLEISRMSAEPIGSGENSEIAVEVLLEANADVTRKEEIEAVVDAYCIGRESVIAKNEQEVCLVEGTLEKTHQLSIVPEASDVTEIIDTFAEVKNVNADVNEHGEIMVRADVTAGMLAKGGDGEMGVYQKTQPAEISVAADKAYALGGADCEVKVVSCSMGRGKNEVSVLLWVGCRVSKNQSVELLSSMDISSEQSAPLDPKTALTIYFAQAGEDAFDIAKQYNTSARAVMEENGLETTQFSAPQRILIPMIR